MNLQPIDNQKRKMNFIVRSTLAILLLVNESAAFVGPASPIASSRRASSALSMMDLSSLSETSNAVSAVVTSSGIVLAETEAWVEPTAAFLSVFLNSMSFGKYDLLDDSLLHQKTYQRETIRIKNLQLVLNENYDLMQQWYVHTKWYDLLISLLRRENLST